MRNINLDNEASIRKRVLNIYNKPRKLFNSDREYDDYLEEIEDIIYNLVNKEDVDNTERKLKEYEELNQGLITELNSQKREYLDKKRKKIQEERISYENRIALDIEKEKALEELEAEKSLLNIDLMMGEGVSLTRKRKIERVEADIKRKKQKLAEERENDNKKTQPIIRFQTQTVTRPLPEIIQELKTTQVQGKLTTAQNSKRKQAEGFSNTWIIMGMIKEMRSSLIINEDKMDIDK